MKTLTLTLALAAVALAGCGSSNKEKAASTSTPTATPTATATATAAAGGASAGGGQVVKLAADPSALKFDKSTLTAKAGKVTLSMSNPSGLPHAVAIEGHGVDVDGKTVKGINFFEPVSIRQATVRPASVRVLAISCTMT